MYYRPRYCEPQVPSLWECPPKWVPKSLFGIRAFLENQFPEQYAARKKAAVKLAGSPKSQTNATMLSSPSTNGHLPGAKVHYGYGCDYCGMFPKIGERYYCRDCREIAGFDLCESCHNTPPKIQGRFNQQHKPNHRLEIAQPTRIILTLEPNTPEQDDDADTEEDNDEDILCD